MRLPDNVRYPGRLHPHNRMVPGGLVRLVYGHKGLRRFWDVYLSRHHPQATP